ncbi:hypothetical protein BJX62DRAFT_245696 [Aspergillus germanicus]
MTGLKNRNYLFSKYSQLSKRVPSPESTFSALEVSAPSQLMASRRFPTPLRSPSSSTAGRSSTTSDGGYSAELYKDGKWQSPSPSVSTAGRAYDDTIDHLIVTVKATQTVPAVRPLTARLKPSSTILFQQNGCVNQNLVFSLVCRFIFSI